MVMMPWTTGRPAADVADNKEGIRQIGFTFNARRMSRRKAEPDGR